MWAAVLHSSSYLILWRVLQRLQQLLTSSMSVFATTGDSITWLLAVKAKVKAANHGCMHTSFALGYKVAFTWSPGSA
jgi:hypothetical protein